MNQTGLFQQQLESTANQFTWAAGLLPTGRHHVMPLPVFGEWSIARLIFHVMWQEAHIVLPVIQTWAQPEMIIQVDFSDEEHHWQQEKLMVPAILDAFNANREALIKAAGELPESAWDTPKDNPFGRVTPRWIITRTIQHTFEHTDTLMKMTLYWDIALDELKQARQKLGEERGSYQESGPHDTPDSET